MDDRNRQPKPDDRSDNFEKLQDMVGDTLENIDEAEKQMHWAPPGQQKDLREKNKRRKEAIDGFRDEMEDENHDL